MLEVSLGSLCIFKSHILLVTKFSNICNSKLFHFWVWSLPTACLSSEPLQCFYSFHLSFFQVTLFSHSLSRSVFLKCTLFIYCLLNAFNCFHKYTCYKVQIPLFPVLNLVTLHLFLSLENPSTFTLQHHCSCHSLLLICSSLFISISFHPVAFLFSSFKVHLKWLLFYENILAPTPATEQMMLSPR